MKKTILASAVAMAMGSGAASAQVFDFAGSFSFWDASGTLQFTVDTTGDGLNDSIDTAVTGKGGDRLGGVAPIR